MNDYLLYLFCVWSMKVNTYYYKQEHTRVVNIIKNNLNFIMIMPIMEMIELKIHGRRPTPAFFFFKLCFRRYITLMLTILCYTICLSINYYTIYIAVQPTYYRAGSALVIGSGGTSQIKETIKTIYIFTLYTVSKGYSANSLTGIIHTYVIY